MNLVWQEKQIGCFYNNQQSHIHGQAILRLTERDKTYLKDTKNMYRITTIATPDNSYDNTFLARIDFNNKTIEYNNDREGGFKPSRKYKIKELIIQVEIN